MLSLPQADHIAATVGEENVESSHGKALTLARGLGMRPVIAHCHVGLGKLYGRTADGAKAREHLATATTMYREMDMRFWSKRRRN